LCLVWWCELSRPDSQTGAFCVWSASECVGRRSATAGRTPTQNALVRRSVHTATPDETRLPQPRLPVGRTFLMPSSHRPPDKTRPCCPCRVGRCELSLETVWQSLNRLPIDHPRRDRDAVRIDLVGPNEFNVLNGGPGYPRGRAFGGHLRANFKLL